ncbi:response regulator receiver protein [Pseudopedobacter saltans DSM 12145]|uniref:Response regulator receiver protein n=1 Tax=Pseudopedobacter saltans (strain ATCC 51119 / DSM 12145 / JCM 21818 / CCUG 39354 / LMG 10337 / NBRC 100064 / NCIMB 13643) TaxID=762903 RepID=F0SEJ3_PSESL|nr:response regulator [Pseudopedobacter saltans]ADY50858.1 response regulator receiver protein [Pseudopedobacter saltans DSM 12145]
MSGVDLKNKKILIVDDDPSIVMSLEFLLQKSGSKVFIASNGREAMEKIDAHQPDLVLLDIMMPEVDGYEVCEYVKKNYAIPAIKVIFISAKSKDEDIKKAYTKGADLFVIKPFSTRRLLEKIASLLKAKNKHTK